MDGTLAIAGIFLGAGLVKGAVGLGLPTIGMGLLVLMMPPAKAAAILTLPAFITNIWQMAGPRLRAILQRTWSMLAGVCVGTWAGAGLMSGERAREGTIALGLALAAYAATSLAGFRLPVRPAAERWLAPLVGLATGLLTAATGVFVIPAVPYLQALDFEKEELVQALALSFTVSTLALTVNLARAGAFNGTVGFSSLVALGCAIAGMLAGQVVRERMQADTFRRWFLLGLLALGLYIAARAAW